MINLIRYRQYWERMACRLDYFVEVLPVTIDKEMGKSIQALPTDSITIFMFPPLSESAASNADAFRETNRCVIFLMKKYNPQRRTSYELLEEIQPEIERIKEYMIADQGRPCAPFSIDLSTLETAPETELYGTFAGWSLAFEATSSTL